MDNYQAVYDAVRSKISGCDIGNSVETVMRDMNLTHYFMVGVQEVVAEYTRPFVVLRPSMSLDGNMYCFLYGPNIQEGIAGFGSTAASASHDFDKNWFKQELKAKGGE